MPCLLLLNPPPCGFSPAASSDISFACPAKTASLTQSDCPCCCCRHRTSDTADILDAPPRLAPGLHVTGAGSAAVRLKQLRAAFVARSQQVNLAHNSYKCLSKHHDVRLCPTMCAFAGVCLLAFVRCCAACFWCCLAATLIPCV